MTQAPNSPATRLLGAAALSLLLAAGGAQAQGAVPAGGASMHQARHHGIGSGGDHAGMAARALDAVGASADQKARVHEIFKAAQAEVQPQREANRAVRQQMLALMAAPQVDAAAAEVLRQQQMTRHDAISRRMLQAMLDAQAVLTPEQRQKLAGLVKSRGEMMQRHQRERRSLDAPRS